MDFNFISNQHNIVHAQKFNQLIQRKQWSYNKDQRVQYMDYTLNAMTKLALLLATL